jgi:GcrA cell cycle regulator
MRSTPGFTWTDSSIEKLKALVSEGLSAALIAAEFGGVASRMAIIGKVHRLGLRLTSVHRVHSVNMERPRKAGTNPTEPVMAALCTIAPLAPTPTMGQWKAKQQDALRVHNAGAKSERSKPTAYHQNRRQELLAQIGNNEAGDIARAAAGKGVTLMQLRMSSCRWPLGDPMSETFLYCGEPKDGISVYCACHSARAYTPNIRKVVKEAAGVGA